MSRFNETGLERARIFVRDRGLQIVDENAGAGHDGSLFLTERQSYLKVFERVGGYRRERDVYRRLQEQGVASVLGHTVPQLLDHDDRLGVLEISVVTPPYVLDFAKARLDEPLEEVYPADILEERWAYWRSLFEPNQWPHVLAVFRYLGRQFGIWLEDLSPPNIRFDEDEAESDQ